MRPPRVRRCAPSEGSGSPCAARRPATGAGSRARTPTWTSPSAAASRRRRRRRWARSGLAPVTRFNATQGASRLLFERADGLHADVFVGRFALCHELALGRRLAIDERTLPLADLLLTKLQVARLNHKDVTDVAALLLDHELAEDDGGINAAYVTSVLAGDWGWWRTVTENLAAVRSLMPSLPLSAAEQDAVTGRIDALAARVEAAPKGARWRMRARIGERRPWRQEPEERA